MAITLRAAAIWLSRLAPRTKVLGVTWLLFALLLLLRVHGSSVLLASELWAPGNAQSHYLADPILSNMDPESAGRYRALLMAKPNALRTDEWAIATLWSIAQTTHEPPFPVKNMNLGSGQNMLLIPWVPVLHIATLARPVTWGYLLMGRVRGLVWAWWLPPFMCFTALFLLFDILFPGRVALSVFGALWFCMSAYNIAWSHWPAYTVGFGALTTICAYWAVAASERHWRLLASAGLGIAITGFGIQLYVPWLIPLAYVFGFIFVGLVVRERLWRNQSWPFVGACFALMLVLVGGLVGSFLLSSRAELAALAGSVYPGHRRLYGGDLPLSRLMSGIFNGWTIHGKTKVAANQCEAAAFVILLPTVAMALAFFPRLRQRFDAVAWSLLALSAAFMVHARWEIPQWIADVTLMSHVPAFRGQIGIGVTSIVLVLYLMASPKLATWKEDSLWPAVGAALSSGVFYLWEGVALNLDTKLFSEIWVFPRQILFVALAMALLSLVLLLGATRIFSTAFMTALVVTSGWFNPLVVGYPPIEQTELRQAIRDLADADLEQGRHSYFLAVAGPQQPNLGTVVAAMGGHVMTGVIHQPQLDVWHALDPEHNDEQIYNRYAEIYYFPLPLNDERVVFNATRSPGSFNVRFSPLNARARQMGARYVVTWGPNKLINEPTFQLLYEFSDARFKIWKIPE